MSASFLAKINDTARDLRGTMKEDGVPIAHSLVTSAKLYFQKLVLDNGEPVIPWVGTGPIMNRDLVRIPEVQGKWFYTFTDSDYVSLAITEKTWFQGWVRLIHTDGRKSTIPTIGAFPIAFEYIPF